MAMPMLVTFSSGILLRFMLSDSGLAKWLAEKNEISTPLTSWKRVTEGLALYRQGVSPYSGDIFHQMPIVLRVLNYLSNLSGPYLYIMFLVCDLITAVILERVAKHLGKYLLDKQSREVRKYSVNSSKLILTRDGLLITRLYVVAAYLLNPYTLAACLAKSTAVFNNMAIALAIMFTLKGNRLMASISIAVAAYLSMYPIMLVVPAAIYIAQVDAKRVKNMKGSDITQSSIIQTAVATVSGLGVLLGVSYILENNWSFLSSTYGFTLSVPDLTPNIGVFWYFFTEMFEHFRLFFLCVFQINAFIYTVPLAIRLKDHPIFLMYVLVAIMSVFKSYPSYGDAGFYLAMLPLWKHCFQYTRNTFIVACMFVVCTVLSPILYHLWIYAGSANANFYFAITLVYSTAQVFLVTDLLFGFLRREYDLLNGTDPKMIDGKPAPVILD